MRLLLINLDKSADRLELMRHAFARRGLEFTRVAAVNGGEITEAERDSLNPDRTLSAGELAARLSHRKCWEIIVDENLPCAAIFEDDVVLSSEAARVLKDLEGAAPSLGVIRIEFWPEQKTLCFAKELTFGQTRVRRLGASYLGAAGYIVSHASARKLLSACHTPVTPIDHFIFDPMAVDFCRLQSWQSMSPICVQMMFVPDSPSAGLSMVEAERARFRAEAKVKVKKIAGVRKKIYKIKTKIMRLLGILQRVILRWPGPGVEIAIRRR